MFTIAFAGGKEIANVDEGDRPNIVNRMGRQEGSGVLVHAQGVEYLVNADQIFYLRMQ